MLGISCLAKYSNILLCECLLEIRDILIEVAVLHMKITVDKLCAPKNIPSVYFYVRIITYLFTPCSEIERV